MAKYRITPSSKAIMQLPISIGHKAEKGVEAIEFDLTAWVETYGSGTLTVIMRRWGDAIPYPIALEIDENNKATWTLSDIDTAKAGMAYAQLSYIVGDEVVKKSDIYTFRVMDSLTGEGEPPEAYESWLEHLTHFAAEAMAEVLDIESIVTDKTLTVDGGIADAKATGDALALKADKSTTYTKTEVDQMIEDVEVETDTTLSVSGAPADAKKTGDALSALEDQFSEETDKLKADLDTLADITPIPDNSDLNDYDETGLYSFEYGQYTILNYPPVEKAACYLEVRRMTTGYVGQKLTIPGNGKVFTRRRFNNGQWNNWIQITGLEPGNGLSEDAKNALIACFANVEWAGSSPNGDSYINALKNALGMTVTKTFTYPSGGLGSTGGRIQVVSSSDKTATINTAALQACTVGASSVSADTANLAFNGIYGIKQGSFTKIKYYAITTSTNSGAYFNIGCVVCKIIDGVYTVLSMTATETATAPNGIQVDLPENPNNDNYIFLKVEGVKTNARTELAALKMVLTEGSSTPSTPTPTQEIAFTPDLNIYADENRTPALAIQSQNQRQSFGAISNEPKIISIPDLLTSSYSLIRVPSGKTTVTVTCVTSARCNLAWFDLTDTYQGNPYYHFINQTGWQTKANTFTFDITGKEYIAINFESTDSNSSNYTLTMS